MIAGSNNHDIFQQNFTDLQADALKLLHLMGDKGS